MAESFEKQMCEKFHALDLLSIDLGMIPRSRSHGPTQDQLNNLQEDHSDLISQCMTILVDKDASIFSKVAVQSLLDYYDYTWRERFDDEFLGYVLDRHDPAVKAWREKVLARDGHRCVECGSGNNLHAHHVVRWVDVPLLRVVVGNGKTLCQPCHMETYSG